MSHDALSPQQFGFKPEDEEVASYVRMEAREPDAPRSNRRISLRPGRLRATQSYMDSERVNQYAKHGWAGTRGDEQIHVARYNDEEYLLNGHHRIAAAMKRGNKRARVSYTNLDE